MLESFTGDIITPVKGIINKGKADLWASVENQMAAAFINKAPVAIRREIDKYDLMHLPSDIPIDSAISLVKDCDKFALVLECAFEKKSGNVQAEMLRAQPKYIDELRNSEWPRIREYTGRLLDEYA